MVPSIQDTSVRISVGSRWGDGEGLFRTLIRDKQSLLGLRRMCYLFSHRKQRDIQKYHMGHPLGSL